MLIILKPDISEWLCRLGTETEKVARVCPIRVAGELVLGPSRAGAYSFHQQDLIQEFAGHFGALLAADPLLRAVLG